MPVRGKGSRTICDTTAHYFTSGNRIVFVFWENFDKSTVSRYELNHVYDSSRPHTRINGSYTTTGGKTVQWDCETVNGYQGTFNIGEEKFDLALGCLLLVSAGLKGSHVVQLKLDRGDARDVAQTLDSLSRTEPEIRRLVGG
jgi:hypothetical protein